MVSWGPAGVAKFVRTFGTRLVLANTCDQALWIQVVINSVGPKGFY